MDKDQRKRRGVFGFFVGVSAVLAIAAGMAAAGLFFFVTNPFTPSGEVGYVYEEPRFFGQGGFLGTVDGPGSFGGSVKQQKVINIRVLPEMHSEEFDIRAGKRVGHVVCEVTLRVDPGGVKQIVEGFGAADWYRVSVRGRLLRTLRSTFSEGYSGDPNMAVETVEAVALSALEEALERRRIPVWVEGVFIRRIEWVGGAVSDPKEAGTESDRADPTQFREAETVENPETAKAKFVVPDTSGEGKPDSKPIPDSVLLPGEIPPVLIDASHPREFRGLWLATVSNVDWPSREGLPPEVQKAELIEFLDIMAELQFNALIFQVRPAADAFYRSEMEPWSKWLTGELGADPGFDPLEIAIVEGRRRGIEVHAWFNPYRAAMNHADELPEGHVARRFPEHAKAYGRFLWMDPGAKPVQEWIMSVIKDVVSRYDVAGVHLDDYFYPYPLPGREFDDTGTYLAYVECCGPMELSEWRRHNIHTLVHRLSEELHSIKPHLKFGISPFGLYRPGEPEGVKGLDQVEEIYSDPKRWLDRGWVDYITPQLYWKEDSKLPYSKLLDWWGGANSLRRHIYAGSSLGRVSEGWPISEFETQVTISRGDAVKARQSLGNVFFGAKELKGAKGAALQELFKKSIYPGPALPPVMGWLEDTPEPPRARHFLASGTELRWDAPVMGTERWTLYRRDEVSNGWRLFKVLPAEQLRLEVESGSYALCAVDPMMRESVAVVAEVGEPAEPPMERELPARPDFEKGFEGVATDDGAEDTE